MIRAGLPGNASGELAQHLIPLGFSRLRQDQANLRWRLTAKEEPKRAKPVLYAYWAATAGLSEYMRRSPSWNHMASTRSPTLALAMARSMSLSSSSLVPTTCCGR